LPKGETPPRYKVTLFLLIKRRDFAKKDMETFEGEIVEENYSALN
jgi:hypothetical protein